MIAAQFIFELLILAVGGLGWGLVLLGRWRCNPVEKLCGVIAVSWTVVYLATTGIYLAHLPVELHYAVSGVNLVLLVVGFGELKKLWRSRQVRQTICGFGILFLWNVMLLGLIRNYSGGTWAGDWYEHYERSLFFIQYLPMGTKFLKIYDLPARPPMMNTLCAHVLAQAGSRYDLFQIASAYFNLLIYFPCVLLTSAIARRGRRQLVLLVVFFAASPLLVENVTYTWTKMFAGFYILLGTWFYLRGFQKQDSFRLVAAFATLCLGMLVHYSAGPYLLFFALHYALVWHTRKNKWIEPVTIAALCLPILATWLAWSFWFYGWHTTVSSNTAVTGSQALTFGGNLEKIGTNILGTILPHPLHVSPAQFDLGFYQPNDMGHLRDYWFLFYQPTVPEGIGIVGGLVVIYLIWRNVRVLPKADRIFWLSFIIFCTLVGIAAHGEAWNTGVGHICLLPLSMLGVAFLAANFPTLPAWLRMTAALGLVFDFCFGIFLHVRMEHLYFQPQFVGTTSLLPLTDLLLSRLAVLNSNLRIQENLVYWGDHFRYVAPALEIAIVLFMAGLLYRLALAVRGGAVFYLLLIALIAGAIYCAQDEFNGVDDRAARELATPMDELQAKVARASIDVQSAPESSVAQLALGEAFYRVGDTVSATDHIADAFSLDLDNQRARYDILLMYYTGSQLRQDAYNTMTAANNVIKNPDSAEARQQLGIDLLNHHHFPQAVAQLNMALQLSGGSSADSLMLLGIAHQLIGGQTDVQQSIDCLSQALRLRPDSSQIAGALRNSLHMRGDSDADIQAFIDHARGGQ
jgi:tetratricopeptide (TPR) repeat protein